ncbi:MAG: hypothetical protein QXZ13_02380 [Candidatus Diapherotrites archaeon]
MKLIEATLFKLCLNKKISIEEAKIIKALYTNKTMTFNNLIKNTGLEEKTLFLALNKLAKTEIITENSDFYSLKDFETKLIELTEEKKEQKTLIKAKEKL